MHKTLEYTYIHIDGITQPTTLKTDMTSTIRLFEEYYYNATMDLTILRLFYQTYLNKKPVTKENGTFY